MENIKEVVANEEVKEAVLEAAENIVAENSDSVIKKIVKGGIGVAGVAGVLYLGYRFVAKPIINKIAKKNQDEIEVVDGDVTEVDNDEK